MYSFFLIRAYAIQQLYTLHPYKKLKSTRY